MKDKKCQKEAKHVPLHGVAETTGQALYLSFSASAISVLAI
jgi:hypothetical protein